MIDPSWDEEVYPDRMRNPVSYSRAPDVERYAEYSRNAWAQILAYARISTEYQPGPDEMPLDDPERARSYNEAVARGAGDQVRMDLSETEGDLLYPGGWGDDAA